MKTITINLDKNRQVELSEKISTGYICNLNDYEYEIMVNKLLNNKNRDVTLGKYLELKELLPGYIPKRKKIRFLLN